MESKKISRSQLNTALKALPVPVQEHCKRCKAIANYLVDRIRTRKWFLDSGLNPSLIVSAVYLHDIGKTQLQRDNLYAEHNIAAHKRKLYRSHVELGVRMIEESFGVDFSSCSPKSFEAYVYQAITEHHEKADGSGFPAGKTGKDFSLIGRITAVANTVDHLLFVGADPQPVESIFDALEQMSGTELDNRLVRALLSNRKSFIALIESLDTQRQNKRKKDEYGLQLLFSDIMNLQENDTVEHLVRYVINDPYYGVIRPEVFLPVSEKTSQTLRLCKLALERVCLAVNRAWDRYAVTPQLAVTIPIVCLTSKSFVPDACKILQKYAIKPKTICLIIDGYWPEDELEHFTELVTRLKTAGYRIAISGMGEGSDLMHLLDRISVEALYISESYTHRILENPATYGVASGILDIAHNLHMRVIFLGVDDHRTERELLKMTAKYGLGKLHVYERKEHEFLTSLGGNA